MRTSIEFGGEDSIAVDLSLEETTRLVQNAMRRKRLIELTGPDGAMLVFNPLQVKLLVPLDE